jgi:cyclic pyranopterin phosphate synthase
MARRTKALTHISPSGKTRMVDVSHKASTKRQAVAAGTIRIAPEAMELVRKGRIAKGNVIDTARMAGIMAAKKTSELVPLCHPLPIDDIEIDVDDLGDGFEIRARVVSTGKTGVEMEALTAVAVTALTFYDMVKAADRSMVVGDIRLLEKSGGKSGTYIRKESRLSRKSK